MKRNYTILLAVGLILIGAASRIVNHESGLFNLAPVMAISLFSGAILRNTKLAYIVPILCLFIADLYIELFGSMSGFYGWEQLFVYGPMALVTFMGSRMNNLSTGNKGTSVQVLGYTIGGSLLFFIVSNFGSFLTGMHGLNLSGLATTYIAAIPFYQKSFASDFIGSGLLFGTYFLVQRSLVTRSQKA